MSNEEIIAQVQQGINIKKNYELLYNQNIGLICSVAKKYIAHMDMEDLMQEAFIALVAAVEHYSFEKGMFSTYMGKVLSRHFIRYIHNNNYMHISEAERAQIVSFNKAIENYISVNGKKPNREQTAAMLNINIDKVKQLELYSEMMNICSIDTPCGEDDNCTLSELLPAAVDIENDVIDCGFMEEVKRELWKTVDSLEEQQPQIIKRQYQDCRNSKEICEELKISENEYKRQQRKALQKLRKIGRRGILRQYADEYIYSAAIRNYNFKTSWTSSTERVAIDRLSQSGY